MSKFARVLKDNTYTDYSPQELIQVNAINFKNWSCSAGTEGLFIDWQGDVWPATCFVSSRSQYLGSIHDTHPIKLLDSFVTCEARTCPCLVEIYLPKYKNSITQLTETATGIVSLSDFDAIARASEHDKNRRYIMWAFGRKCNFKCSYCDDQSHSSNDNDMVPESSIKKVLDYALEFKKGKPLMWSFTGGEPTINPFFLNLVKQLHENGDTITVASNGSQHKDYYAELAKYANINISVHFEYLKPTKLRKVVSSILEQNPAWFGLNFMIMPSMAKKCYNYIEELKDIPDFKEKTSLHFDILRKKNTGTFELYSEEEMSIIQKLQSKDF